MTLLHLDSGRHRTLAAKLPSAWIRGLAFTSDGRQIVAGAFDGVHVWDVSTGAITETYAGQPANRSVITLDPRGDTVYTGYQDGSIDVYDLSGRRRLGRAFAWNTPQQSCWAHPAPRSLPLPPARDRSGGRHDRARQPTDAAHGADAAGTQRGDRQCGRVHARRPHADHRGHQPDGHLLERGQWPADANAADATARVVDGGQPRPPAARRPDPGGQQPNSIVYVVALATGRIVQTHLVAHGIGGVEFTDDGRELVALGCCESGSTLTAWARLGRRLFSRGAGGQATSFDIARDGRLLALGTADGEVLLLDPRTGAQARPPLKAAAANIEQVAFSPDERTLAVAAADGTASLWDLGSRTRVGDPFPPTPGVLPSPVFEPNGRRVVGVSNLVQWPLDVRTWERFACHVAGRQLSQQSGPTCSPAAPTSASAAPRADPYTLCPDVAPDELQREAVQLLGELIRSTRSIRPATNDRRSSTSRESKCCGPRERSCSPPTRIARTWSRPSAATTTVQTSVCSATSTRCSPIRPIGRATRRRPGRPDRHPATGPADAPAVSGSDQRGSRPRLTRRVCSSSRPIACAPPRRAGARPRLAVPAYPRPDIQAGGVTSTNEPLPLKLNHRASAAGAAAANISAAASAAPIRRCMVMRFICPPVSSDRPVRRPIDVVDIDDRPPMAAGPWVREGRGGCGR